MATEFTGIDAKLNDVNSETEAVGWAHKLYAALNEMFRSEHNRFDDAAFKDTGTAAGNIPLLNSNGKVRSGLIPDTTDTFAELEGTPDTYAGKEDYLVQVNPNEDKVVYISGTAPRELEKARDFASVYSSRSWVGYLSRDTNYITVANAHNALSNFDLVHVICRIDALYVHAAYPVGQIPSTVNNTPGIGQWLATMPKGTARQYQLRVARHTVGTLQIAAFQRASSSAEWQHTSYNIYAIWGVQL